MRAAHINALLNYSTGAPLVRILRAWPVRGGAALNAVTELVDHERGRSDNTRIESAWFGTGAALKNRALELLSA